LKYDKQDVIDSALKNGFDLHEEQFDEEWVAMCFKLRN
jgi:hypothetical protein